MDLIRLEVKSDSPGLKTREWLECDQTGGYASSCLDNCHRRKYHGLLVANLGAPHGRQVILSKLEDSLVVGDDEYFLSRHQYPGVLFPEQAFNLTEVSFGLSPRFTYGCAGGEIAKSPRMICGEPRLLIEYRLRNLPRPGLIRLKPFLAFRGYHGLAREDRSLNPEVEVIENGFRIRPCPELPEFFLITDLQSSFEPRALWYYNFEYEKERQRGYDFREDLFLPGTVTIQVDRDSRVMVSASLKPPKLKLAQIWSDEEKRRQEEAREDARISAGFAGEDRNKVIILLKAARQFLITSPSARKTLIAGYPWFTDWGRDSLIALPGLCFTTGRLKEGLEILIRIALEEKGGLLPNFFAEDGGENPYNTVDSSLWLFWTCQQYLLAGGEPQDLKDELFPAMKRIIRAFSAGTGFNIRLTGEGLLEAGTAATHLTWMDATVEGKPVTPRFGCAVEINALWYNALCFARELAGRFSDPEPALDDSIARTGGSFSRTFWREELGYLGDVFSRGALDPSLRPNQILAVSLPYSPLAAGQKKSVVEAVTRSLLTPRGLRTLAPEDPAYRGRYQGTPAERDGAYHQGTVWPWLMGHYGEACLKAASDSGEVRGDLLRWLRTFLAFHLEEAGVGTVSEIFSGDPPYGPDGCIAQAWSVAEIIRLYFLLK